ncbi:MAG: hypothetical protein QOI34_1674 [Verrucomicrobiota bacterium]
MREAFVRARNACSAVQNLTASDSAHDEERLNPFCHRIGQAFIWGIMRNVFATGEESYQRTALLRVVIADRAAQHRVGRLETIDNCARRNRRSDIELYFSPNSREGAQMLGKDDADHDFKFQNPNSKLQGNFNSQ